MLTKPSSLFHLSLVVPLMTVVGCSPRGEENLSQTEQIDAGTAEHSYPDPMRPDTVPRVFAPGVVSTDEATEGGITFSPDGSEIYFTRRAGGEGPWNIGGRNTIWVVRQMAGQWTEPAVAEFSGVHADNLPYITPDGMRLFFGSERPDTSGVDGYRIWFAEKSSANWSAPEQAPITGMYLSATQQGEYFTTGILRILFVAGEFTDAEEIGIEGVHPFVDPEGSYLLFDRYVETEDGVDADIHISLRDSENAWSEPVPLGETVNTSEIEGVSMISPDGRYLFFARGADIYWVEASVLDRFISDSVCSLGGDSNPHL